MHELTDRHFLQKKLNPQKGKGYCIHIIAQTEHEVTSSSLAI
jgi:hypothetical protein